MLPIEKNVPIPEKSRVHRFDEIPWSKLEIGDSVVVHCGTCGGLHNRAQKHGINICIHVEEYAKKGLRRPISFRIWRLEDNPIKDPAPSHPTRPPLDPPNPAPLNKSG
jgi:hypothetical protein